MSKDARLGLVLAINLAMIVALVAVGLVAHSLAVLASAADYVGDAAGVPPLPDHGRRRRRGRQPLARRQS
jgi:hypothetical protein